VAAGVVAGAGMAKMTGTTAPAVGKAITLVIGTNRNDENGMAATVRWNSSPHAFGLAAVHMTSLSLKLNVSARSMGLCMVSP